jgi:Na+-transporting NADH:ubiquinone oxidoreductase subunit F
MVIRIPEEVMGIKKWECEVVSNRNVATFIKEFVVKLPEGENLEFNSGAISKLMFLKLKLTFPKILKWMSDFGMNGINSICGASK